MKYDFTSIIDRMGKDASAVESVGVKRWGAEPDAPREGFDFIPANRTLSAVEIGLVNTMSRETVLKRYQITDINDMTPEIYAKAIDGLKRSKSKAA